MAFYIDKKAWNKVLDYAKAAYEKLSSEITGYLLMEQDQDGDYVLHSPVILPQEVTGSTCEIEAEESAKYFAATMAKIGKKRPNVKFVWWHSHANMGVFWSATDTTNMAAQASKGWAANLVVNCKNEYKFRINVFDPLPMDKDIELHILEPTKKIPKSIYEEVEAKCKKTTYTHTHTYWGKHPYGQQQSLHPRAYNAIDDIDEYWDANDWLMKLNDNFHIGKKDKDQKALSWHEYQQKIYRYNKKLFHCKIQLPKTEQELIKMIDDPKIMAETRMIKSRFSATT